MAAEHSRRNSGGFFFIFVVFNTETNLTIHVLITISFLFFGYFFCFLNHREKRRTNSSKNFFKKKSFFFFCFGESTRKRRTIFLQNLLFFSNATPSFAKFSFWVHRREKDFQNLWDNFIEKNKNVATVSIRSLRWTIHLNIKLFLLFLMIIFLKKYSIFFLEENPAASGGVCGGRRFLFFFLFVCFFFNFCVKENGEGRRIQKLGKTR